MTRKVFITTILSGILLAFTASARRTDVNLVDGWSFYRIDGPIDSISRISGSIPAGLSSVPVTLPHDWSTELPFSADAPSGNDGGYITAGSGWYTRTLHIPAEDLNLRHELVIEGAYEDAQVYVNGKHAGGHHYGFSTFSVNLSPYLHAGENVVTISVDNSRQKNCRWYTGSGLYRPVRLVTTLPTHLVSDHIGVTPKFEAADSSWTLEISAPFEGAGRSGLYVSHSLADSEGQIVAEISSTTPDVKISVDNPLLWSPESPNLYHLTTCLLGSDSQVLDSIVTTTGFRHIEYDAKNGLRLNSQPIVLNGGCVHHDCGILGSRSFPAAEARKVALLKEAGFNAVRTSHNPPSIAFLDECDRQGLLVIDEAFDGWRAAKNEFDYSTHFDAEWPVDIDAMVYRDRNHPSIFCWSIGNEVIERKELEVVTTADHLAKRIRSIDPTRPVTSALTTWDSEWEIFDPLAAVHDIAGYNYQMHHAKSDHGRVPSRVIMQTESYPRDAWYNYTVVRDNPYVIGDFVWTAIDYLGESGIGRYYYTGQTPGEHFQNTQFPWHGAYCGDIDITGWRKPVSHYRQMLWNPDTPISIGVREPSGYNGEIHTTMWSVWPTWESWNWKGHEGRPVTVEVYSRSPRVRLYLNDNLIGEAPAGEENACLATFDVPYAPGNLRAEGIDNEGNIIEKASLSTAGAPAKVRLTPVDYGTPDNVIFVVAEVVDSKGRVVPDATNRLSFALTGGDSQLLATGSADLTDLVPYVSPVRDAWKGRVLVALKRSTDPRHPARLSVASPGLKATSLLIR